MQCTGIEYKMMLEYNRHKAKQGLHYEQDGENTCLCVRNILMFAYTDACVHYV